MGVPLLAELKRRRVFRALLGYAIVAFAVLQIIEPVIHGLQLPDWTLSFVVVAIGVGFPLTLALAWVFDLSASGIERTRPVAVEAHRGHDLQATAARPGGRTGGQQRREGDRPSQQRREGEPPGQASNTGNHAPTVAQVGNESHSRLR